MADHQLQLPLRLFHGCEILDVKYHGSKHTWNSSIFRLDCDTMQLGCLTLFPFKIQVAFSSKTFTGLTSPFKVLIKWPQDSALPIVEELSHHHCPLSAIPPPTFQCQHGPSHTRGSMRNKFKHIQSVSLEMANTTDYKKNKRSRKNLLNVNSLI